MMKILVQKGLETAAKIVLVAALVFGFSWALVQVAQWKSAPEVTEEKPVIETQQVPLILLAKDAELNGGGQIKLENFKGKENIGWWDYDTQWISWKLSVPQAGNYKAVLFYSRPGDKKITTKLTLGTSTLTSSVSGTGGWDKWSQTDLGTMQLTAGEKMECSLKVENLQGKGVINFIRIELTPIEKK